MNVQKAYENLGKLIEQGKGEAILYVSDSGAGVAESAALYDNVTTVGEDTQYLDGEILDEEEGTEVVFVHFN